MQNDIGTKLATDGFAMNSGYLPEVSGEDAFSEFGTMVSLPGVAEVQVLTPRHTDHAPPNTYSGNFGIQAFPLHTDLAHWFLPPRFFALRCVTGSRQVSTTLIDVKDLMCVVERKSLKRALVRPRRPVKHNRLLLRLLSWRADGCELFRWGSLFIVPATNESQDICETVVERLASIEPKEVWLENPGDTLIIDNWRMLHGRSEVSKDDEVRRVERAYFGDLS